MKGYVINVKTKEKKLVVDDTPLPTPPSPRKLYRVYKTLKTSKGRIIKISFSEPVELTKEEIDELKKRGYIVEEIEW